MPVGTSGGQSVDLAGNRRRFCALLVDSAVQWLLLWASIWTFLTIEVAIDIGALFLPFIGLVAVVVFLAYYPYFWVASGQTPGKKLLGIKVVRADGSDLSLRRSLLRYVGYFIGSWMLYLGFIWALFDRKRQGWHDKIADTQVIRLGAGDRALSKGSVLSVLAVATFLIIQTLNFATDVNVLAVRNFKIFGSSMRPTLERGQYVMFNTLVYKLVRPKQGELVLFHFPRDTRKSFVKRVIALPGDTIEIRQGKVFVNGFFQEEPYIARMGTSSTQPLRLRDKEYFVMGDNRRTSNDSRAWGPVPEGLIFGRHLTTYWPLRSR